ncbi:Low-Density Lipoprotein Receptor-Related Protein 10 [Manis pentadactyla]|nr:Low-Density Lipoprotein Receptor-Related Protein 10 [Manis pentadactyla]
MFTGSISDRFLSCCTVKCGIQDLHRIENAVSILKLENLRFNKITDVSMVSQLVMHIAQIIPAAVNGSEQKCKAPSPDHSPTPVLSTEPSPPLLSEIPDMEHVKAEGSLTMKTVWHFELDNPMIHCMTLHQSLNR